MILKTISTLIPSLAIILLTTSQAVIAATIELIGLTDTNTLVSFSLNNPTQTRNFTVTNLLPSENLLGIDFRPANGQLFGITDANRIVTIDPTTGLATLVSTASASFTGTNFGVDFNPIPDRLRVVSDTELNYRINVDTGAVTVDTTLAYSSGDANFGANPNIQAAAYTNSFAPSPRSGATTLYVIDSDLDILATQGGIDSPPSPNGGQLFTIGSLGVDFGNGGFDILSTAGSNGIELALAASGSSLYTINLSTGSASSVGTIGNGSANIIGLTSRSVPESNTLVSILGLSTLVLFGRLASGTKC